MKLGSGEFVENLWRETGCSEVQVPKISLDEIMRKSAEVLGCRVELLRQRNRIKELADMRADVGASVGIGVVF